MHPTKVERQREMTEIFKKMTIESEDPLRDELLWGIPNDVTLRHIATLLPRRAYEEVVKVNPDWQRAFQARTIYNERVRSQKTETFLVVSCKFGEVRDIDGSYIGTRKVFKTTYSLFSPSEKLWYKIPPIPGCNEVKLYYLTTILLDGKMYILGGMRIFRKYAHIPSSKVLVLDLARQPLEWRRCANMRVPRYQFHIRIMQGKIFVFGGYRDLYKYRQVDRNEVYDPKLDAWSFIAPTMPSAYVKHVYSIGQQFFVCIVKQTWRPPTIQKSEERLIVDDALIDGYALIVDDAELYRGTKVVVTVGDRGPKLICSPHDDDEEDDMDGLHKIIEDKLVGLGKPVGDRQESAAKDLASLIENQKSIDKSIGEESFYGFYVPDKDEWRGFEQESLGTDVEDGPWPLASFSLLPREDDDGPRGNYCPWLCGLFRRDNDGPRRANYAEAFVWSVSL